MGPLRQAWRPAFVQELRAFPRYQSQEIGRPPDERPPKCDVCNRSQVRPSVRPCVCARLHGLRTAPVKQSPHPHPFSLSSIPTPTKQVPCTYDITLSGPRYDSLTLWQSRAWEQALPFPLDVLGTAEEKPLEQAAEAEEAHAAKEEKEEALATAKRERKRRPDRTPGWPRVYYAGSTCMYKTKWCVAWRG